jgi:predicted protein tyrosine phosphatase
MRVRFRRSRSRKGRRSFRYMTKILFVCGKNRRRSPSAEEIFTGMDGIEVSSAGTSPESVFQVDRYLLNWADRCL